MRNIALVVTAVVLLALAVSAQSGHHDDRMAPDNKHYDQVNQHGDMAMGFSHLKTTHHFRLSRSGGSIEVLAKDPNDAASRDQVRMHLQHVSQLFKSGDFSAPMETHGRVPPGVPTMQRLKADITYRYEETARGGKVLISTANPKAVKAIHEFLRFQIQDHRTADSADVQR
jgi:hypothetical protein